MLLATIAAALVLNVPAVHDGPPIDGSLAHDQWKSAATASLKWDLQGHKLAPDSTTAYILSDGAFLYVAFDAKQRGSIVATQRTNDVGQGSDDDVTVSLWPGGINGFLYQFTSNPIGTHYQSSTENSGYRPQWSSAGRVSEGGYVVTMKIPLSAIHGASAKNWLIQFSRRVEATGDVDVWGYDPTQTDPATAVYAGTMTGLQTIAVRPRPRIEMYGLGSIAGRSAGGPTSRLGADLSIPYTPTSSFYATLHPDYSNVELDQQSISPTAFRRYYQEVRPFFTQGNAAYNNFDCDLCNGIQTLYTPAIPTPRDGYAVEGVQGPFTYGAFDAVGADRNDSAQAVTWKPGNHTIYVSLQRVSVHMPGFYDDSTEAGVSYFDHKHVFGYFNYGSEKGTNVGDGARAQLYDSGAGWQSPTTTFAMTYRKIGDYFNPTDGYVWHPGIAGWGAFFSHAWLYPVGAPLRSITLTSIVDRYHDHSGALNQTDNGIGLDVLTRGLIDINVGTGSNYLRLSDGSFTPVTQNAYSITLGSGAANSSVNNGAQHGQSATPTTLAYATGRFGAGRLNAWSFTSTQRLLRRGLISFELDENNQRLDNGTVYRQWFERISYAYQMSRDASFAFGVRRIIGTPPVLTGPPEFQHGWNISAAYHRTFGGTNEIYAVYGDASAFSTVPQFIIKWIHYVGAGKGT